jgi:hypothetical protein
MKTEADPYIALICVAAIVLAIICGWYKKSYERRNGNGRDR